MLQGKLWTEGGGTKEPGVSVLAGRSQFLCRGKNKRAKIRFRVKKTITMHTKSTLAKCVINFAFKKKKNNNADKSFRFQKSNSTQ